MIDEQSFVTVYSFLFCISQRNFWEAGKFKYTSAEFKMSCIKEVGEYQVIF